jgi:hypothetical protein
MPNTLARRVARRWIQSTLRPTCGPMDRYEMTGEEVPEFYHAGQGLVKNLKDHLFHGWYGYGFYAAFDAEYVRRWYGPVVTKLRAKPEAKVLVASVDYESSPSGLLDVLVENEVKYVFKGDRSKVDEFRGFITENPIQWVHAVDRVALEQGYEIVLFSDEQIVVKPTNQEHTQFAVTIEGEVPPNAGTS